MRCQTTRIGQALGFPLAPSTRRKRRSSKVGLGESTGWRPELWFQADVVIHGTAEPLLAAHVSFCRLYRDVAQEELNGSRRSGFHHMPYHLLRDAGAPNRFFPADAPEQPPLRDRH